MTEVRFFYIETRLMVFCCNPRYLKVKNHPEFLIFQRHLLVPENIYRKCVKKIFFDLRGCFEILMFDI